MGEPTAKRPRIDEAEASNDEYHQRAAKRDSSLAKLVPSVQYEISELFARRPNLRDELEACCWDSLAKFEEFTACEIVQRFGERELTGVRSTTAYFCGLLKRYRERGAAAQPAQPSRSRQQHVAHTPQGLQEQAASVALLTPVVRDAVEDMFRSGDVHRSEMEPCCFESLRDFADAVALKIIKDFRDADMHTLRNKTGFFCSLLKQHRAQTGTLRHPSTPGVISTTPWSVRPPTFAPVTPAGYHPPPWPPPYGHDPYYMPPFYPPPQWPPYPPHS